MADHDIQGGGGMRHRPIYGGPFGRSGRYLLATVPHLERGLHAVRFSVLDPVAGAVLAVSNDKRHVLEAARRRLRSLGLAADAIAGGQQGTLWPASELPSSAPWLRKKRVSRRRLEVFRRSGGRCHYCDCDLQVDGDWHVEHQMPKALGGSDEAVNLAAACSPCNLSKSDRSAVEFVSRSTASEAT